MYRMDQFLSDATAKIPGRRERELVRSELEGHLQDRMDDMMAEGMDKIQAEAKAVQAMGDVAALAEEMGQLHPFDSGRAYERMILLLWLGIMLPWVPIGTPTFVHSALEILGTMLLVYSLFRMKDLNHHMQHAAFVSYIYALLHALTLTAAVLPIPEVRVQGSIFLQLARNLLMIAIIWNLRKGLTELCEWVELPMKIFFYLQLILFGAETLLLISGNGNLSIPSFMVLFLIAGVIFLFYWSTKVMHQLLENAAVGVEYCPRGKQAAVIMALILGAALPLLVSVSYGPLSMLVSAKEQILIDEDLASSVRGKVIVGKQTYSQLPQAEQELLQTYLAAIPEEEYLRLNEANKIEAFWKILGKGSATEDAMEEIAIKESPIEESPIEERKLLFLKAETAEGVLLAELTRWDRTAVPYEGVSFFSLYQNKDGNSWGFPLQNVARQKGDKIYRVSGAASFYSNAIGAGAVECRMDPSADAVLIYQSYMIPQSSWSEDIAIFAEESIRKLPWRIPYQEVQIGSWNADYYGLPMDMIYASAGQEPLRFLQGCAQNMDTATWRRRGEFFRTEY